MIMHRKSDRTTGTLDDDFSSIEILYNVRIAMNLIACRYLRNETARFVVICKPRGLSKTKVNNIIYAALNSHGIATLIYSEV